MNSLIKTNKKIVLLLIFLSSFSVILSCSEKHEAPLFNAKLANLSISSGTLSPAFLPDTMVYSVQVPYEINAITLIPTVEGDNAIVKVNGIQVASGTPTSSISLDPGENTIIIEVTSEKGSIEKTYAIVISRLTEPSHNASLAYLSISSGALLPAFSPDTTAYSVQVPNEISAITLISTVAGVNAVVEVNGSQVVSGVPTGAINLNTGLNSVTIKVVAEDGSTEKTYTVEIRRLTEPSHNANLSNLSISSGTLTPVFSPDTTAYSVQVPNEVSAIMLIPTVAGVNAVVKVNGTQVVSGIPTGDINLNTGLNSIIIKVVAEDGSTEEIYTVVICRLTEPSHNADLAYLSISSGTLTPVFSPDTTAYSVQVPNEVISVTLIPTVAGVNAVVTVNGTQVVSGIPTGAINLNTGPNSITIKVVAEDGTTSKTYSIIANRFIDQGYIASIIKSANIPDSNIVFIGENTSNLKIKALRPLVDEIFATYGFPSTNLDKARAIRDFVARYAIHPFEPFHANTIANLSVLPEGKTWADFIATFSHNPRFSSDSMYWYNMHYNGFNMLNALFGTINLDTLQRNDDGMLSKIDIGRYRIKDFDSYRAVLCSYQTYIYISLLASTGLHGIQSRIVGHDPAAVFIPELGKWVYEDPGFNEEYTLDGNGIPLSPVELLFYSVGDDFNRLIPLKTIKPNWDSNIYINNLEHYMCSYIGRMNNGFLLMGSQLRNDINDNPAWNFRNVQIAIDGVDGSPFGAEEDYLRVSSSVAFPDLGVGIEKLIEVNNGFNVFLKSSFPNHIKFIKKINNGAWQNCNDIDFLPLDDAVVTYRSMDSENFHGMDAIINIVKKPTRTY